MGKRPFEDVAGTARASGASYWTASHDTEHEFQEQKRANTRLEGVAAGHVLNASHGEVDAAKTWVARQQASDNTRKRLTARRSEALKSKGPVDLSGKTSWFQSDDLKLKLAHH